MLDNIHHHWKLFLLLLGLGACHTPDPNTAFVERSARKTGIHFSNTLTESDSLNIIQYLYFYNGGGVAVGDVNNDGWPDLYLVSNQNSNRLYLNRGHLQFEDVTEKAGVPGIGNWNTGVTMADVNGDGWLDIYVSGVGDYKGFTGQNALYLNQQDGTFREVAAEFGLDYVGFGQQALFWDYDLDGDLDCYLLSHSVHAPENYGRGSIRVEADTQKGDRLLQNDQGRFVDVSRTAGIYSSRIGFGLGLVAGDIDNNGYPDLYVANDFHENDYLYLNQGQGQFREVLSSASGHTSRFSMGTDLTDFDQDGWIDIFSLDMKPESEPIRKSMPEDDPYNIFQAKLDYGYHPQFTHNALQRNLGVDPAREVPILQEIAQLEGVDATDWSWSALFFDADNDGDEDLWVTNGILRRPTDLDYLNFMANEQVQKEATDLQIAQGMPNGAAANYFFDNADGHFQNTSDASGLNTFGYTHGGAWADLDLDGDLDLVANHLNREASIYENRLAGKQHYLRLRLEEGQNTWGIGARVTLFAGEKKWQKELFPTRGWQSSQEPILHFGLGEISSLDSLVVRWPSGGLETFRSPPIDTVWYLSADSSKQKPMTQATQAGGLVSPLEARDLGIQYMHRSNEGINDFDFDRLAPRMLSREGPTLATADVNKDGWDDIFLGANPWQAAQLYLSQNGPTWEAWNFSTNLEGALELEHTDAKFADLEGDGDLDLVAVGRFIRGGGKVEIFLQEKGAWQPIDAAKFTPLSQNANCVEIMDLNGDQQLDLFVGRSSDPGQYGISQPSSIWLQEKPGQFRLLESEQLNLGMVNDAVWNPEKKELVVVGDWTPVWSLTWEQGDIARKEIGPSGWWQSIICPKNFGQAEYVLGNWGNNMPFEASSAEPLTMYLADFNQDGKIDKILSHFVEGKEYPFFGKDRLIKQITQLKKSFLAYGDYAQATVPQIFSPEALAKADVLRCETLATGFLTGTGDFVELPSLGKSPILAMTMWQDQYLLGVGNFYDCQPSIGQCDAQASWIVDESFSVIEARQSGWWTQGDFRDLAIVYGPEGAAFLLAVQQDGPLLAFRILTGSK